MDEDDALLMHEWLGASVRVILRQEADEIVLPQIERFSALRAFRNTNPLALKLLDFGLIGNNISIAAVDSDVLFLRPITCLFPISENQALFMRDLRSSYSISWKKTSVLRKVKLRRRINTGLFSFPRSHFDLEFVDRMLQIPEISSGWQGFVEQTLWAALAARVPCLCYNSRQVVVVDHAAKVGPEVCIAHFPSPARYRLAEAGPVGATKPPAALGIENCGNLLPSEFLLERLQSRLCRIGAWA